jgi:hypothetical protein
MKFSIRNLLLITLVVAISLGWWIDRSRLAARDAQWEESFRNALTGLSFEIQTEHSFETPGGLWTMNRTQDADK